MRSPADMSVIMVECTNRCHLRCSNCTRLVGHQKEPFSMDFETFKKAVDSLKGYDGMVALIGGEPTLHPEFDKFATYLRENIGYDDYSTAIFDPVPDFLKFVIPNKLDMRYSNRRGLWTAIGPKYYDHMVVINDTFHTEIINDHARESYHESLLGSRKELMPELSDKEWHKLRDNCWIQNLWSASVTPKGAFFCEVAAAMDATLGGPGGWPIEPGWWKRKPEDFGDQLKWCEMCTAALPMPKRAANSRIDDVTPMWMEKLVQIGSPKVKQGLVEELAPKDYAPDAYAVIEDARPYMDFDANRIGAPEKLLPKKISCYIIRPVALTAAEIPFAAVVLDREGPHVATSVWDYALSLEEIRKTAKDWVLVLDGMIKPIPSQLEMLKTCVFNPGVLYRATGLQFFNVKAKSLVGVDYVTNLASHYPAHKVIALAADKSAYELTKMRQFKRHAARRWAWFKQVMSGGDRIRWMGKQTDDKQYAKIHHPETKA